MSLAGSNRVSRRETRERRLNPDVTTMQDIIWNPYRKRYEVKKRKKNCKFLLSAENQRGAQIDQMEHWERLQSGSLEVMPWS